MFIPEGQIRVFLYGEPVSMRLSFDGLYALARHRMQQDPLSGNLFAFIMQMDDNHAHETPPNKATLTAPQLHNLVGKLERENINLRRQVAWFQRQIFGQKSEKRPVEPDGVQASLGESFTVLPNDTLPNKKSKIAAHERQAKPKCPTNGADESTLFFDDKRVPVEVIAVPNPEVAGLNPDEFDVIGEKVTHRLAQRPGSYVVLKYVRPVIKRRDTQTLSCPAAPVGVIDGSRADVSFVVGVLLDKCAYHQPLYRQHQRMGDCGIKVSRPWMVMRSIRSMRKRPA